MLSIAWVLLVVVGCSAANPRVQYAPRPAPLPVPSPPPKLDLSTLTARPMPMQRPQATSQDVEPPDPDEQETQKMQALEDAAQDAMRTVLDGRFHGAVHEWEFEDGEVYEVPTQVGATTTLQLEPGEQKIDGNEESDVLFGNSRGWGKHQYVQSGDAHGRLVWSIVIRPDKPGPDADVTIFTNLRTLHLWLRRVEQGDPYVRRVRLRMLKLERQQLMAEHREREALKIAAPALPSLSPAKDQGAGCTSANYEIEVIDGDPSWVPTTVWRQCEGDIAKVHIQFPANVRWSKVPALSNDGAVATHRYDSKQHVMHVDGLFRKAILQLGSDKDGYERVRIRALRDTP
jgi:type IV secretory pathway VirB9-like protein